jgi:hypothetical protein
MQPTAAADFAYTVLLAEIFGFPFRVFALSTFRDASADGLKEWRKREKAKGRIRSSMVVALLAVPCADARGNCR